MAKIIVASDAPSVRSEVLAVVDPPATKCSRSRPGPELLASVAADAPDLVVVDIQMGNMGGMAVCLELRLEASYGALPHIAVLMLLDRRADVFLGRRVRSRGMGREADGPDKVRGGRPQRSCPAAPTTTTASCHCRRSSETVQRRRVSRSAAADRLVPRLPAKRRRAARAADEQRSARELRRAGAPHHRCARRPARHDRERGDDPSCRRRRPPDPGAFRRRREGRPRVRAQLLPGLRRRHRQTRRRPLRERSLPCGFVLDGRGGAGGGDSPSAIDISRRLRQPYLVPESRRVLDVLAEMRRVRRTFAVVVDEYGGVAGVITVKDLLAALVGDLYDEFDPGGEPEVVRVDRNRWLVDGGTSIDDVRSQMGLALPEGKYVTSGGYIFDALGHIPVEGERLKYEGWELRVVEMDKRRVAKVVAVQPTAPAGETRNQRALLT